MRSTTLRPFTPPLSFTSWKHAFAPRYSSMPSPRDGPENAADVPSTISVSVTPVPSGAAPSFSHGAATPPAKPLPTSARLVIIYANPLRRLKTNA